MFDFRYHALSLVAVFVALLIGLLLGVAIGDQGLVSSAERDLRSSLRSDVNAANDRADELRDELGERRRFEEEVYPPLVANRLVGQRVAIIFLGDGSDALVRDVRAALTDTGGQVVASAELREPLDVAAIAERSEGTRYEALALGNEDLAEALGVRLGVQLVSGGRLFGELRPVVFQTVNGELGNVNAVVLVRRPAELEGPQAATRDAFERGMVRGLRESGARVVGAEREDADPSQIGWYEDRDLTSVDAVDRVEGRAALVLALAGAEGTFGVKDSAGSLLPEVVGARP